jgi:hypothetical protein
MCKRPIVLLVPPILDCSTGPFLGIANLKGYLRAHSPHPVRLLDWNIECLSSRPFFEAMAGYLRFLQHEGGQDFSDKSLAFLKQIEAILGDFDNPRLREHKVAAIQVLFKRCLSDRDLGLVPRRLRDKNLYKIWARFFDTRLDLWRNDVVPVLLGISVSYYTQLVPALIVAWLAKERFPELPVVLGGNFFWHLPESHLRGIASLPWIDFIVQYEGEVAFHQLALACDAGESFGDISNLVWTRGEEVVFNPCVPPPNIRDCPAPDFEDLNLDRYVTGLLPYQFSRGCYWARCNFCDIPRYTASDSTRFRAKNIPQVVTDIQTLQQRFGDHPFYLVTTAIPPALCESLCRRIEETGARFDWLTMVRADPGFTPDLARRMSRAGCRQVAMGLESASDRVLGLMNKGITRSVFQTALDNFTAAGIEVMVEVLVDFPGTTAEEAWDTFEFLKANREKIQNVNLSEFMLASECAVMREPERFGVRLESGRVDSWHGFDRPTYETTTGMSYSLGKELTHRIQRAWMELTYSDPLSGSDEAQSL